MQCGVLVSIESSSNRNLRLTAKGCVYANGEDNLHKTQRYPLINLASFYLAIKSIPWDWSSGSAAESTYSSSRIHRLSV